MARGAVRGTVALITRGAGLQAMGFVAFIGIARLISPSEFGQFAIALAVQEVCLLFVVAGLPASLIRQRVAPTASEQRALAGFSLLVAVLTAGAAVLLGFAVLPAAGVDSALPRLIAIALLALPLFAARMIPFALLARSLRFDRVAMIDVAARTALYLVGLPAAALFGIYGLAAAIPVSAAVSAALASRVQPWARGFSLDFGVVVSHLKFGLQVGALRFSSVSLQFGVVAMLAIIGTQALAGFYGLSRRVLAVPFTAVGAVQRVGFPALARVTEGSARSRTVVKATAVAAVGVGAPLAVLAGSAQPLVSALFGDRWLPAADIIILSAPGLLVFASIGSVIASHALADGDVRSPLIAAAAQIALSLGLIALLTPRLDAAGAGIALGVGYLVYAAVLFARFRDRERWFAASSVLRALLAASAAAAAAQAVRIGDGLIEVGAAIAASTLVWLLLSLLLTRSELASLLALLRRHLRSGSSTPIDQPAQPGASGVM